MSKGYIPEGNMSSDNIALPYRDSGIMNEEKKQSKSFGTIIDELFDNPEVMIVQASRMINEAKKEEEKLIDKNKKLEEVIIVKDKEIAYLNGRVDTMEKIISKMNKPN